MKNKIEILLKYLLGCLMLAIMPHIIQAQGVSFETKLNWQQIYEKAKKEHKYVFVDCYATWCGPCKQMDQNVYSQKEVGDALNINFISVKLQMDKTKADDATAKGWYPVVDALIKEYAVNAFPTFLFFGPDGRIVHKAVGYRSINGFLHVIKDVQNPARQYYRMLKSYRPGSVDTEELKPLAREYFDQDGTLAGRFAGDYLARIPKKQLVSRDNLDLMSQFRKDPLVAKVITSYLHNLDKQQLATRQNLTFLSNLSDVPSFHELGVKYILSLSDKELSEPLNQDFADGYAKDENVKKLAKQYIAQNDMDKFLSKSGIVFAETFTDKPIDAGFKLFYAHSYAVDHIMGNNDYAQYIIAKVLLQSFYNPSSVTAERNGTEPDWQNLYVTIKANFNTDYASRVVLEGKLNWTKKIAKTKNDNKSWTDYLANRLEQIKACRYDTLGKGNYQMINGIAWQEFVPHVTDKKQLETIIDYMKAAVTSRPKDYSYPDTYAWLLYKNGQTAEALEIEQQAVQLAQKVSAVQANIDDMKKNLENMEKAITPWK